MDDTRELVSETTVRTALLAIGIGGPILGAAVGLAVGIVRRAVVPALCRGFGIGLLGLLVLAMWYVYNGVLRRLGFDSVRALLVNLGIFAAVGVAVGGVVGAIASRRRARPEDR
jgi:hypothetical protein